MITLTEYYNKENLVKLKNCTNVPITNEKKQNQFTKSINNYNGKVRYSQKHGFGRYYTTVGMQYFPKEIRKYLADNMMIDIDIENCHPVLLQQLFEKYKVPVPELLQMYNSDRSSIIKEYKLNDKLYMIKFINNSVCYNKNELFKEFHDAIYNKLVPLLITIYPIIYTYSCNQEKKHNIFGVFMACVLQDIENDILMIMYEKLKLMKIKVMTLAFDGLMISRSSFEKAKIDLKELFLLLEQGIELKSKIKIKLTEKNMNTEWKPNEGKIVINELDKTELKNELDIIGNEYSLQHESITKSSKKEIEARNIMNKTIMTMHNMFSKQCNTADLYGNCNRDGYQCYCKNCNFKYPDKKIEISENISPIIYNMLTININENIKNKDTKQVGEKIREYKRMIYTEDKLWYIFNEDNGIYICKHESQVIKDIHILVDSLDEHEFEWKDWLNKRGYTKNLIYELQIQCFDDTIFDDDMYLLGFSNGVLDLRTNEFRKGKKDEYVSKICGVKYDIHTDISLANEIFEGIFQVEEERNYMINRLSLCLEGDNREQTITFNYGYKASNGKSFLMELVKKMFGDYGGVFDDTLVMNKKRGAADANTALMNFKNKRFMYCSEPEAGNKLNTNFIKSLTGDVITTRGLYKDLIEIKPTYNIFMCCNILVQLDAYDEGISRRIRIVEFDTCFKETPKKKGERLLKTYSNESKMNIMSGLMIILINNYDNLRKNEYKYTEPKVLEDLRKLYLNDTKGDITNILSDIYEKGDRNDFITMNDIKNVFKNNEIKIDIVSIKKIIESLFDGCEYKLEKKIDKKRHYKIFECLKEKQTIYE